MRKTRAPVRRRRPAARQSSNPGLVFDIAGIALVIACFAIMVALARPESSGAIGGPIADGIRATVGVGAFIVPLLIGIVGVILIAGPLSPIPRNIFIGSLMIFFVVIAWAAISYNTVGEISPEGGGAFGNTLGLMLTRLVGTTISYIILTAIGLIAIVVIIDVPLLTLIEKIREILAERAAASREFRAARLKQVQRTEPTVKEKKRRAIADALNTGLAAGLEAAEASNGVAQKPIVKINGKLAGAEDTGGNGKSRKGKFVEPKPDSLETPNFTADAKPVGEYVLPPTTLLNETPPPPMRIESELHENIEIIERTLSEFKVEANVVEIACGPTFARYEIQLAPGIKVSKITSLADNLAMQLATIAVRLEAPIPGKAAIGVEVPNKSRALVGLREVLESSAFKDNKSHLAFALGKDVAGTAMVADLAKMPHLLVGGTTNSGKSVCLNSLIASMLFKNTPDELKMVMIDPKRVELTLFDGIPHLACPVVQDIKQASGIFRALVQEMDRRYTVFARMGVRNLVGYNERVRPEDKLPYIVLVVDELCDLMMQMREEVEDSITRLAQLARATGIHLVIATQRPAVDVVTGLIKANISSRIAFAVQNHHDSRIILDQKGAEALIGKGDMLFLPIDANKATRMQGCFVDEKEIETLCDYLKEQRAPNYTLTPVSVGEGVESDETTTRAIADEYYERAVRYVVGAGSCSTSMLQRKYNIGYTRAARIVDAMHQQGIVGPRDGANPRAVLVGRADLEAVLGGQARLSYEPDDMDDEEEILPEAEYITDDDDEEEDNYNKQDDDEQR